jgi:hypothetical protein
LRAEEAERKLAVFAARVEALEEGLALTRRDAEQRVSPVAAATGPGATLDAERWRDHVYNNQRQRRPDNFY